MKKNNKGVTLITVVVIIIVIIIIATVSVVAGNKLVLNTRSLTDEQIIESVRESVSRKKIEVNAQGSISPKGGKYPGKMDPLLGDGSIRAEGWYVLDDPELIEIGVKDISGRFLVNYEYNEVINMGREDYLEKYLVCTFLHDLLEEKVFDPSVQYIGEKLQNKVSGDVSGDGRHKMYVDVTKTAPDYYGTGWYVVTPQQIIDKLSTKYTGTNLSDIVENKYLINYKNAKYVMITLKFSEI